MVAGEGCLNNAGEDKVLVALWRRITAPVITDDRFESPRKCSHCNVAVLDLVFATQFLVEYCISQTSYKLLKNIVGT